LHDGSPIVQKGAQEVFKSFFGKSWGGGGL
jgi:hypothetical protein